MSLRRCIFLKAVLKFAVLYLGASARGRETSFWQVFVPHSSPPAGCSQKSNLYVCKSNNEKYSV